jgi:hypothetical protein
MDGRVSRRRGGGQRGMTAASGARASSRAGSGAPSSSGAPARRRPCRASSTSAGAQGAPRSTSPPRCPQRDSNPCYGLERAATWTASRWGRRRSGYRYMTQRLVLPQEQSLWATEQLLQFQNSHQIHLRWFTSRTKRATIQSMISVRDTLSNVSARQPVGQWAERPRSGHRRSYLDTERSGPRRGRSVPN